MMNPKAPTNFISNQKRSGLGKQFVKTMQTLLILFLWISPGFGDEKPFDCKPEEFDFCESPCAFFQAKCNGNAECILGVCSYWYPICYSRQNCPQVVPACWSLVWKCENGYSKEDNRNAYKRSIFNKKFGYLLLKLHPYLNQTSQFGFLTSGRIRRITGNFGTEFLGKRDNSMNSSYFGKQTKSKTHATSPSGFYNLPLKKFAQTKIMKKGQGIWPENRINLRGNRRIVMGSEFLGKRRSRTSGNSRLRKLAGSELLGKRNSPDLTRPEPFLSGYSGKKLEGDLLKRSEFLEKKSIDTSEDSFEEPQLRKYAVVDFPAENTFKDRFEWPDSSEFFDEAFYNYNLPFENPKMEKKPVECLGSGVCGTTKNVLRFEGDEQLPSGTK